MSGKHRVLLKGETIHKGVTPLNAFRTKKRERGRDGERVSEREGERVREIYR